MVEVDETGNRLCSAPVRPIHVPMAIGAMRRGVELGPETITRHLHACLAERSRERLLRRFQAPVHVPVAALDRPDGTREPGCALYLDDVAQASARLAQDVSTAIGRGELALVLGGDHALSIGSIAGAASQCQRLAVIWIDAHADMNWPEVSPSGRLHGMSLGASLGRGPSAIVDLHCPGPKLLERDTTLVGIRLLDPGEEDWLRDADATLFTMPDIDEQGLEAVIERIIQQITDAGVDAVHISFDVDSLDPSQLPGTGTPVHGGLTYREMARALRRLHRSSIPVHSVDWVELNPALDQTGASADVAAALLAVALGDDVILRAQK